MAALSIQAVALAQAQPNRPGGGSGQPLWNPEFMMDIYVKSLTRTYNLTPDQEEYTRKLLTKRVKDFLKDHETDLRTLMVEMFEFQGKRQLPPSDTARQWSDLGTPIFKDARKAILDGNKEWRDILNEQQRKRHDQDMELLNRQFKIMEERLGRWGTGKIDPDDFTPAGSPRKIGGDVPWADAAPEDAWETYFRVVASRYGFDASQRETGQSVLRECKERAKAYREKHKGEFDAIDTKMKELKESRVKDNADKDAIAAAMKAMDELRAKKVDIEKPISQGIFAEFKQRLDQIPTKEQKAAFDQKEKARQEAIRDRTKEDRGDKASETQPAATSPTTAPST